MRTEPTQYSALWTILLLQALYKHAEETTPISPTRSRVCSDPMSHILCSSFTRSQLLHWVILLSIEWQFASDWEAFWTLWYQKVQLNKSSVILSVQCDCFKPHDDSSVESVDLHIWKFYFTCKKKASHTWKHSTFVRNCDFTCDVNVESSDLSPACSDRANPIFKLRWVFVCSRGQISSSEILKEGLRDFEALWGVQRRTQVSADLR